MQSSRPLCWVVAAVGAALAVLPNVAHADANSEFEARREEERKNYDTMIAGMPLLNEQSIGRLLRASVENRILIVRTQLGSTNGDGYMRVKLTDPGMSGLIRIQGGVQRPATEPVI